jgi:hypothetical protein
LKKRLRQMDRDEEQHIRKLLHACDEVLEYHDRAGSSETAPATEVRKSRRRFQQRLRQSTAGLPDSNAERPRSE